MDHYHQTPQKEQFSHVNRRIKSTPEQSKKNLKSSKKNLSSAFTPVSQDVSLKLPKESIDISSISEVFDENQLTEFTESFITSSVPVGSPSSQNAPLSSFGTPDQSDKTPLSSAITHSSPTRTVTSCSSELAPLSFPLTPILLDQTPLSSATTPGSEEKTQCSSVLASENIEAFDASVGYAAGKSSAAVPNSFEMDLLVKHLRQCLVQVSQSTNVDFEYKRLLDVLIKTLIEEFYSLNEENDWLTAFISKKVQVLLLSFVLWIIGFSVVFFIWLWIRSPFDGPRPT